MNELAEKGSDFLRDLGDAARNNPISATLIGMGVLWMLTGARGADRVGSLARGAGLDSIPDVAGNAFGAARSSLRSGAESIGDRVSSATETLREGGAAGLERVTRTGSQYASAAYEYAQNIPQTGGALFGNARESLSELFRAQPLALGAIGLAIGAGIAAALPATDLEAEYFGQASDQLKERAVDLASEQAERVAVAAEEVIGNVSEEARRQGLTVDAAKAAAADIPAKVGRVVDAAGKGFSEKLNPAAS